MTSNKFKNSQIGIFLLVLPFGISLDSISSDNTIRNKN